MEREQAHNNFESSADFQETPCPHTIKTSRDGVTAKTLEYSFATAMEYASALEEKSLMQSKCIIELKSSLDGQTVLTKATDYAASAVTK